MTRCHTPPPRRPRSSSWERPPVRGVRGTAPAGTPPPPGRLRPPSGPSDEEVDDGHLHEEYLEGLGPPVGSPVPQAVVPGHVPRVDGGLVSRLPDQDRLARRSQRRVL